MIRDTKCGGTGKERAQCRRGVNDVNDDVI